MKCHPSKHELVRHMGKGFMSLANKNILKVKLEAAVLAAHVLYIHMSSSQFSSLLCPTETYKHIFTPPCASELICDITCALRTSDHIF